MVTRRTVLMTGGAAVVIAGLGYAGSVATRNIRAAQEPWRAAAEGFGDPRLDALAYAILAPNPHNKQPWLIELTGAETMTLYCDLTRLLPHTDPPNRQITIGLGAFLELLRQAGAEKGYRVNVDAFPEGEPYPTLDARPIAHIHLTRDESVTPDPLFGVALQRRTAREAYDARAVPGDVMDEIGRAALLPQGSAFSWTSNDVEVAWLKDIASRAWRIELETDATWQESVEVTRIGADEINANPDGISLGAPFMEVMGDVGLLNRAALATSGSIAHSSSFDFYNGLIAATSTFGMLSTDMNTRVDQLRAGATWVRLNQAATQLGIQMHPLSQVLQEFPEMAGPYDEIHAHYGVALPARIQGLFRFGYGPEVEPAPRWPLESRLISA